MSESQPSNPEQDFSPEDKGEGKEEEAGTATVSKKGWQWLRVGGGGTKGSRGKVNRCNPIWMRKNPVLVSLHCHRLRLSLGLATPPFTLLFLPTNDIQIKVLFLAQSLLKKIYRATENRKKNIFSIYFDVYINFFVKRKSLDCFSE
jgi:hypothetical protein